MRRLVIVAIATAVLGAPGCDAPDPVPPPPAELLDEDRTPVEVRSGDMDGDGVEEVAVSSRSPDTGGLGFPTPHLEVFAARDGEWVAALEGRGPAPPGAAAPPTILLPVDEAGVPGQRVEVLELVDLAGDGSLELVVAVANMGATAGPLELWVISRPGGFRTEHYFSTTRGGEVRVRDDVIELEFGVYRANDPGCCPSRLERMTVGWDPDAGGVAVLSRERRRVRGG